MNEVTIDTIVAKYVELRDGIDRIKAEAKAKVEVLERAQEQLESVLMKRAQAQGVSSFKTAAGTAFITTSAKCGVADWDAVLRYVEENRAYNLLNKAVNKTAVQEYINANEVPPPGVNWSVSKEIQVRRS